MNSFKNNFAGYQQIIEKRSDVIIFETEPFRNPFTIAGPVSAVLYASSSAIDTDFSLTLTGVNKEGLIFPIGQTFWIIRARYRNTPEKAEQLNIYYLQ